ncbi:helix-turn-helix domain-containing protein [candidate division KSB1 bacterium]|nr:helix-turn-helix domain-containing protein [candidate division KSB1 bacterium]
MTNIGEILKHFRIAARIKQKDMAKILGISPAYLSLVENTERDSSLDILQKYANALDIPVEFLILQSREPKSLSEKQMEVFDQIRKLLFEFQNPRSKGDKKRRPKNAKQVVEN